MRSSWVLLHHCPLTKKGGIRRRNPHLYLLTASLVSWGDRLPGSSLLWNDVGAPGGLSCLRFPCGPSSFLAPFHRMYICIPKKKVAFLEASRAQISCGLESLMWPGLTLLPASACISLAEKYRHLLTNELLGKYLQNLSTGSGQHQCSGGGSCFNDDCS